MSTLAPRPCRRDTLGPVGDWQSGALASRQLHELSGDGGAREVDGLELRLQQAVEPVRGFRSLTSRLELPARQGFALKGLDQSPPCVLLLIR